MTAPPGVAAMPTMRFFNTEGPVRPDEHYAIPPLDRVNLDELLGLVRDKKYFVLHAPRQTGKTSALLALRDRLHAGGDYRSCKPTSFAARRRTAPRSPSGACDDRRAGPAVGGAAYRAAGRFRIAPSP